jgi:DNA-dependent metalloprotease WSS1
MVHVRINEREANPNPHINFITPLPVGDAATEEDARQLLRALAAQVKPVMKAHGFTVNSFEEVSPVPHSLSRCSHILLV